MKHLGLAFLRSRQTIITSIPILFEIAFSTVLSYLGQFLIADEPIIVNSLVQCNNINNVLIALSNIPAIGALILLPKMPKGDISQQKVYAQSFWADFILGILISLVIVFLSPYFFILMNVNAEAQAQGQTYMIFTGSFVLFQFLNASFYSFLRVNKMNREISVISLTAALLNIGIQALGLFVFRLGILSLALGLSVSRALSLLAYSLIYAKKIRISLSFKTLFPFDASLFSSLIKEGSYAIVENISYSLSMVFAFSFINKLGLAAGNLSGFVMCFVTLDYIFASAMIQEVQIEEGQMLGRNQIKEADRAVKDILLLSLFFSCVFALLLLAVSYPLFSWLFRDDKDYSQIALLAVEVFAIDFFLELGRTANVILVRALQVEGSGLFVMLLDIPFSWFANGFLSYLFSQVLPLGLLGIWGAFAFDATGRAYILFLKWNSEMKKKEEKISETLKSPSGN